MDLIRVLIVDDHALVRRSLQTLLNKAPDMVVVGAAANGVDALEQAAALKPDLILMDISMPRMDGVTATQRILNTTSSVRILILSMYADAALTLRAFKVGAHGVLIKTTATEELLPAIRQVISGERVLSAVLSTLPSLLSRLDADIHIVLG